MLCSPPPLLIYYTPVPQACDTSCSRSLPRIVRAIGHLSVLVVLVGAVITSLINQAATKEWRWDFKDAGSERKIKIKQPADEDEVVAG
jgi:hypothetical protein